MSRKNYYTRLPFVTGGIGLTAAAIAVFSGLGDGESKDAPQTEALAETMAETTAETQQETILEGLKKMMTPPVYDENNFD